MVGVNIERVAYRPLRDAPRISVLISAIDVSFFLENLGLVVFGGRSKAFFVPPFFAAVHNIKGVAVSTLTLVIPAVTAALLAGLLYLIYRTRVGMAMRAVAKDVETARLMASDVDQIISLNLCSRFFLGGHGRADVGPEIPPNPSAPRHHAWA